MSRLLLVLAIIIFVAVIIVFVVLRATTAPPKPIAKEPIGPKIIYEATLGDIKFTFQESRDMGKTLFGSESRFPDWQKNLTTTPLIHGAASIPTRFEISSWSNPRAASARKSWTGFLPRFCACARHAFMGAINE